MTDRYDELMERRERLRVAWLRHVHLANELELKSCEFYSPGIVLTEDGDLWMHAHLFGEVLFELSIATGQTQVTKNYAIYPATFSGQTLLNLDVTDV